MGINISKLDESALLPTLGRGDWLIALPNDYPDVLVPAAWRERRVDDVSERFVRWVLAGMSVEIIHDYDPPWDTSGMARRYQEDPRMLLARYETLAEWMDEEFTGNSTASYLSGMGLFWETYKDDVERDISEQVSELLEAHLHATLCYLDDDDDDMWMEIFDNVTGEQTDIVHAIFLQVGEMTTQEAWQRSENAVRLKLVEEEKQRAERAAQRHAMQQQAQEFWQRYFPELDKQRIEKPEFKALHLAERLRDRLADTDPDVVRAIVEVGLPGLFSNSVALEIQKIARCALE